MLVGLYCCSLFVIQSQTERATTPLIPILQRIQASFNCTFSYNDEALATVLTVPPPASANLKECISFLESRTSFRFIFLTSTDILVRPKNTSTDSICGTLRSLQGKRPIEKATLQMGSQVTTSAADGTFEFLKPFSSDSIRIQCLGYVPKTVAVSDFTTTACLDIYINKAVEQLEEIILLPYLTQGISKKTDGAITIDYTNFGLLPGLIEPDLLQTIQALPGIVSVEETVSDINVRGGTKDQNLLLWDGIKMYQSGHFFGLISAFNPYLTKNIQVYKNGSPARYGDGVSSVIAMHTSDSLQQQTEASIGANLISVDGHLDTPLGKRSSIQFAARRSINEWIETPIYTQYFEKAFQNSEVTNLGTDSRNSNRNFSFYDASVRWLYRISNKDLLKVNALLMRNRLVFQENAVLNREDISRESSARQHNTVGSLRYTRQWNPKFNSDLLVSLSDYNLTATNVDILNNQRLLQENKVLESGLQLNTNWEPSSRYQLNSGYQFTETGITNVRDLTNPTFRDAIKEVIRTHSIYSGISYSTANNATQFQLGLRANYYEKLNSYRVEPRIHLQHQFWNHFTVETSGELKSQVTTQVVDFQNDFLGVENRRWVLANDTTIPIVKSSQLSQGISYFDTHWRIGAEAYYKQVKGITTRSQGFQNQYEFVMDHGTYTVKGVEFLISSQFRPWSTWLSYSYANNDYTFANLSEVNFPNVIDIRHTINTALTYATTRLKLSAGLRWHSGKPTTLPALNTVTNGQISYEAANSSRLKDYFRIDISGTYQFSFSKYLKGFVGVSLWNVFHQDNEINSYYRITDQNQIENIQQLGLGLTPNAIFRLSF